MSSSRADMPEVTATDVAVSDENLQVELADGRTITVPLAWYPRLWHATAQERKSWRFIGGGRGVHWPALDEDISVANLLAGLKSAESPTSFKNWLLERPKALRGRGRTEK